MTAQTSAPQVHPLSDFFASDGRDADRAADERKAAKAIAQRNHADHLTSLERELAGLTARLKIARDQLAAAVDHQRRAVGASEAAAAAVAFAESAGVVATFEARVEHIETTIANHRKAKP